MKKILITLVLGLIVSSLQAQVASTNPDLQVKPTNESEGPLWRAITPSVRAGVGDWVFVQPSVNTFYQLSRDFAITSWIGGQVRTQGDNWYSADVLVNKLWKQGGTRLGVGFQYGLAQPVNQISTPDIDNNQVFFVIEFAYRFKLR